MLRKISFIKSGLCRCFVSDTPEGRPYALKGAIFFLRRTDQRAISAADRNGIDIKYAVTVFKADLIFCGVA